MMKLKEGVILVEGLSRPVYVKTSETVIPNQQEKYGYTLQEVNDRIRSFRPAPILNYLPKTKEEIIEVYRQCDSWDGVEWNIGKYANFGDPNERPESKLFLDIKLLVKSSATMRGYNHPSKVRGGTYQDVDDFFNFVTLKICERRQKQYKKGGPRIIDNWPSYIARAIQQYLVAYNKSKFDYEVEAYWPMVKDEKTDSYVQKDFGVEFEIPQQLINKEDFIKIFRTVVDTIPEAKGLKSDILLYLLYKTSFSHKRLVSQIAEIVKMQMGEMVEEFL